MGSLFLGKFSMEFWIMLISKVSSYSWLCTNENLSKIIKKKLSKNQKFFQKPNKTIPHRKKWNFKNQIFNKRMRKKFSVNTKGVFHNVLRHKIIHFNGKIMEKLYNIAFFLSGYSSYSFHTCLHS